MAYQIVWTKKAIDGFAMIVSYINENWTENEIEKFWKECDQFFKLLSNYPALLAGSYKKKNIHRGPINRHTMVTYQVRRARKVIVLINIRASKQAPENFD